MENNNQMITVEMALSMARDMLGNVSIPTSILASIDGDQLIMIKQKVIDPVENARRILCDILKKASEEAQQAAQEEPEAQEAQDNIIEITKAQDEPKE